jgi:hypothetical protein
MHEAAEGPGYLGALLLHERRLVLIPLDPERPWLAFRRMRSWMKGARITRERALVDVFRAPRRSPGSGDG